MENKGLEKSKKLERYIAIVLMFVLTLVSITFTGCGDEESNESNEVNEEEVINAEEPLSVEDIYLEVLNGSRSYINTESEETNISEYLQYYFAGDDVKISYAVLDLDENEDAEMIILFEASDGMYLILNYDEEDDNVYGFENVYRGIVNLKIDGTYMASSGATESYIMRYSSFEKTEETEETIAKISDVSDEAYIEFEAEEDVEFIEYETKTIEVFFEEGTYVYTAPEDMAEAGSIVTLTLENGEATWSSEYWGSSNIGTYNINGSTIDVTYTRQIGVDSITGEESEESINMSEAFTINSDGTLTSQTGGETYTKE